MSSDTNIGIDDRNTFELIRSMPGGAEGVKVVVAQLHARGVKVLWPYHPWDHSTHGQEMNNLTDPRAMAELLRDTDSDGFNGDTMGHIPRAFYDAAVELHRPIAMEGEAGLTSTYDLNYITLGWAEGWVADENGVVHDIPDVNKAKWLTRGKAMTNWCDRWSGDAANPGKTKEPELQVAYFNGLGYETWENVWGTWNGIVPRAGETIRRVATLLRYFGRRGFLTSEDWVPHTADVLQMQHGIFGSKFPSPSGEEVVYLLIARNPVDPEHPESVTMPQLQLAKGASTSGMRRWYDCWHGVELKPSAAGVLAFGIEPMGFACVVGTKNTTLAADAGEWPEAEQLRSEKAPLPPADLTSLLRTMATLTSTLLSSFSAEFHYLPMTMVDANSSMPTLRPVDDAKDGEVYVHGGPFTFAASGVEIEGKLNSGVDVQFPWETHSRRTHSREMRMGALYVDKHPVTNAQFAAYLKQSHYRPTDSANWLKQNFEGSDPRAGWEQRPVTYVSLEDAKQYCAFHKKRLPKVYEWQYFAQGTDGRTFPWGNATDCVHRDHTCKTPAVNNNWTNPGPEPVGQYPNGASPFGVEDLVRSVWQYTSEFHDAHTRSVLLRGGSNYSPWRGGSCRWITNDDGSLQTKAPACHAKAANTVVPGSYDPVTGRNLTHNFGGSHWYFPPAFQNDQYNKYFLMSGSYERAGTIGFRCVADAVDDCGTDGKLCTGVEQPPATEALSVAAPMDWTVAHNGTFVRKIGGASISPVEILGSRKAVAVAGATEFSWTGGSGQAAGHSKVQLAFLGAGGGVSFTAAAPSAAGKTGTARIFLGALHGAVGNLSTEVAGHSASLLVREEETTVSVAYKGGPLRVRYTAVSGTVCEVADSPMAACVTPASVVTETADLSAHHPLDWAIWGGAASGLNVTGLGSAERMANGAGMLKPKLIGGVLRSYSNEAATFIWTGGLPVPSSPMKGVKSGVYSVAGTFSMTIPAAAAEVAAAGSTRKLTLYLGAHICDGRLTVSAPDKKEASQIVSSQNSFTVDITWRAGGLTLQAVTLS